MYRRYMNKLIYLSIYLSTWAAKLDELPQIIGDVGQISVGGGPVHSRRPDAPVEVDRRQTAAEAVR